MHLAGFEKGRASRVPYRTAADIGGPILLTDQDILFVKPVLFALLLPFAIWLAG